MVNINLIGKSRGIIKIQSLALKGMYFGVTMKLYTSFKEIKPEDGIYVIFSSLEKEFSEWQEKLAGKKVFTIAFLEKDMMDYPIMYNKIIHLNNGEPLRESIEAGIKYFSS